MGQCKKIDLGLRFRILDWFSWMPDKPWLKLLFRIKNGWWMDFQNPRTFNEKLQWLKIYDYRPNYSQLVDKYQVKEYVAKKIGSEYVIPTLGVWNSPDEIEWDILPNEFVLKTTHGGGGCGVVICKDKATLNKDNVLKELNMSMRFSVGNSYREKPYMGVQKRVIAETLLVADENEDIRDYKFFCVGGKAKFFKVDLDRFTEHRANYYTLKCELLPYGEAAFPPKPSAKIVFPKNLNEMILIAETLSAGIPFLRVDLYNVRGKIYFGELTFDPASGLSNWTEKRWDEEIGDMLQLRG